MENVKDVLVVAVTGGIGCGQSTLANFLEKLGACVLNADEIAKMVVQENPEVREEIRKQLGRQYFHRNGRLNRRLLGQAVFEDERKLHILNKIVHPRMVDRLIEEIEAARESGKYDIVVVDAALVYEINMESLFDVVVVVSANRKNRVNRVKARDGLTEKEIQDRISRQIPVSEKVRWADFVIHNNGPLNHLEAKAEKLYQKLLKKAEKIKKKS